jgi:chromosome segregation ATPase
MEDTNAAPTRQLTGFQTLDRDKRALEHTIYDQELKSAQANIKKLEDERAELAEELTQEDKDKDANEQQSKELGEKIKAAKNEQELQEIEKQRRAVDIR